jgi:hypothetical protein
METITLWDITSRMLVKCYKSSMETCCCHVQCRTFEMEAEGTPKCWYTCTKLDDVTSQKTLIFIVTAIRILNPRQSDPFKTHSILKSPSLEDKINFARKRLSPFH